MDTTRRWRGALVVLCAVLLWGTAAHAQDAPPPGDTAPPPATATTDPNDEKPEALRDPIASVKAVIRQFPDVRTSLQFCDLITNDFARQLFQPQLALLVKMVAHLPPNATAEQETLQRELIALINRYSNTRLDFRQATPKATIRKDEWRSFAHDFIELLRKRVPAYKDNLSVPMNQKAVKDLEEAKYTLLSPYHVRISNPKSDKEFIDFFYEEGAWRMQIPLSLMKNRKQGQRPSHP